MRCSKPFVTAYTHQFVVEANATRLVLNHLTTTAYHEVVSCFSEAPNHAHPPNGREATLQIEGSATALPTIRVRVLRRGGPARRGWGEWSGFEGLRGAFSNGVGEEYERTREMYLMR